MDIIRYIDEHANLPSEGKKEKKEDILERWRKVGFTQGLKNGSAIEWRCAKSMNNMAIYLLEDYLTDAEDGNKFVADYMSLLIFPIIRRLLSGKNRICSVLDPEVLLSNIFEITVKDVKDHLWEKVDETCGKKGFKWRYKGRMLKSLIWFFDSLKESDEESYVELLAKEMRGPEFSVRTVYFSRGAQIDLEAESVLILVEILLKRLKNE